MTSALRPTAARAWKARRLGLLTAFFVAAVGIPMFFRLDGTLYRGSLDSESTFLPLGMITTLGFLVVNYRRLISMNWTLLHLLCFTLLLYTLLLFLFGIFFTIYTGDSSLVIVFLVPIILGVFFGSVLEGERKGERALDLISAIFAMVAVGHVITSVVETGIAGTFLGYSRGSDSVAGLFTIHQRLIYVPLVMAYCLVWTLFISRLKLSTKFLVAAPLLLDIVIDAAREPFLTIVVMVALLTWVWTLEKSAIARRKIRIVVGVFLTLCLAAAVSASVLADTYVIKKFVNIGGGSLDDLTGDRSQKISDFLGDIRDHPLFGQLMQFSTDSRLTPHNQFVEALLRGGIFFLIALSAPIAWVMVVTIRRLLRVRKLEPVVQMALVLSVTFFFVNWNINTPFRSPFCMIYVGMVFGMASTHQAAWRRAPARGRQGRPRPWSGGGPVAAGARRAHWT